MIGWAPPTLVTRSLGAYLSRMNASRQHQAEPAETEEERLARELRLIEEPEAEADAGRLIPQAEMNAWIASLDTDHSLPPPEPSKRR
jgi:predicted transcriptional regulator